MDNEYQGRICTTFFCEKMQEYVCCADCPSRSECEDRCLNHPDRCNLVMDDDIYSEGTEDNPPENNKSIKNGRVCTVFLCKKAGGNVCCADCPLRFECDNPCLNHPSRCNLVKGGDDKYEDGPMGNPPNSRRNFNDEEAFTLWQNGKSDREIGKILGVSRQSIMKWREIMELPSIFAEGNIDTSQYRMVHNKYGNFVMQCESVQP